MYMHFMGQGIKMLLLLYVSVAVAANTTVTAECTGFGRTTSCPGRKPICVDEKCIRCIPCAKRNRNPGPTNCAKVWKDCGDCRPGFSMKPDEGQGWNGSCIEDFAIENGKDWVTYVGISVTAFVGAVIYIGFKVMKACQRRGQYNVTKPGGTNADGDEPQLPPEVIYHDAVETVNLKLPQCLLRRHGY